MKIIRSLLHLRLVVVLAVFVAGSMMSLAPSAYGQSIKLAWDPSPDRSAVGYNIYRSQQSGVYPSTPINGSNIATTAGFNDPNVRSGSTYYYVVTTLNASGAESGYSNEVQATVANLTTTNTNQSPVVNGGADQTISFPASATLAATATDDGLPNGVLNYAWTVVSGAGVTLSSPTASTTQASFSAAGTYTFRVTVSDGQLSSSDDVTVTVQNAPALTLLVSKSGDLLRGAITSIKEYSSNSKVQRLELYIDQNKTATSDNLSLTYKWDLRKVSGTHLVSGKAYDANNLVVATADVTVSVK